MRSLGTKYDSHTAFRITPKLGSTQSTNRPIDSIIEKMIGYP
jgi:hypothetical protein